MLAHPFFDEIDTQQLLEKKIKAPFIPESVDLDNLRKIRQDYIVRLKELQETEIDICAKEFVQEHERDNSIFDNFGTNLDKTAAERATEIENTRQTVVIR